MAGFHLELNADKSYGPAMLALNERQRKFVVALLEYGGDNSKAAALAGYSTEGTNSAASAGYRLSHDPDVILAIQEEAHKRLHSGGILAVSTLMEIARGNGKDKLKACIAIMDRIGLHSKTEHNVNVNDVSKTDAAMLQRIAYLSKELGVDSSKLLGFQPAIEVPFIEISTNPVSVSDNVQDPDDFL